MLSDYVIPLFHSLIVVAWLLLLLLMTATVASVSQLYFITTLINQSAHDVITDTYTRRMGEEVLTLMFSAAVRESRPISVAFFDLDDFKFVNDQFGHEVGDFILYQVASTLRNALRHNDVLVRWGGEEFLVIMPFTSCEGAASGLKRLQFYGFSKKPNGQYQTVSAGVSERIIDGCESWQSLVELADYRLHVAKQRGKNRIVLCQEHVIFLEVRK